MSSKRKGRARRAALTSFPRQVRLPHARVDERLEISLGFGGFEEGADYPCIKIEIVPESLDSKFPETDDALECIMTLTANPEYRALELDIPTSPEVALWIDVMSRQRFLVTALGAARRTLERPERCVATDTYSSL